MVPKLRSGNKRADIKMKIDNTMEENKWVESIKGAEGECPIDAVMTPFLDKCA
jgi:hypothetical protein